jgi:hypothetical protein
VNAGICPILNPIIWPSIIEKNPYFFWDLFTMHNKTRTWISFPIPRELWTVLSDRLSLCRSWWRSVKNCGLRAVNSKIPTLCMGIFHTCTIKPKDEFRFRPQRNSNCFLVAHHCVKFCCSNIQFFSHMIITCRINLIIIIIYFWGLNVGVAWYRFVKY